MATAVTNLYAIPRHSAGATRVNAGRVGGGTASNIVPEDAFIEGELRGEPTELLDYVDSRAEDVLRGVVADVARDVEGVQTVLDSDDLGGSEDATVLMRRVQDCGGSAAYVGIGTDHPGGHHTPRFDVDEASIRIGIDVLSGAIEQLGTGD